MKNAVLAGLIAAQMIVVAQPAAAAGLEEGASVQTGTFAGARIRLSLGGNQQDRKVRAGLTLAPTLRSQTISGETRMRIGDGLELGFAGKRPLTLLLGGRPVNRLVPGGNKSEDDKRLGISTGGWVAIGVATAVVAGGLIFYSVATDCDDHDDECGYTQ